jgi:diaminopimelate epimerase
MGRRAFGKYQGLGNDFVVVDAALWPEAMMGPSLARALCDRHRGVGADGVLWVERVHGDDGRAVRMVIWNADGSRPEMCGNGVRCVVAWLADGGTVLEGETLTVHSDAGLRHATLVGHTEHGARVAVDMGLARVSPPREVTVDGRALTVHPVDVGNPHGVLFAAVADEMPVVHAVRALGDFPNGVNVELVGAAPTGFRTRVNERGVGWTLACGTGACAVVAAAVVTGLAEPGRDHAVALDGGELLVRATPAAEGLAVRMTGPAARVFHGVW